MKSRQKFQLILSVAILSFIAFLGLPDEVFARAGGGGGGKGGGLVYIILLPFFLMHSFILSRHVVKKHRQSKKIMDHIVRLDAGWSLPEIKDRIELVFLKVQEAWMVRDQEIARDYVSDRLLAKHKVQTDRMISQGTKNFLERINLKETTIVEVADYKDDAKDRIWAILKGSMIDIIVDDKAHKIMSGNPDKVEKFTELWKFIRDPQKGWVLDEIDAEVEISDLKSFSSFSESLDGLPPVPQNEINKSSIFSLIGLGFILPWVIVLLIFLQYKHLIFK